ncbi:MAG: hypothetical protein SGARI_007968, partial [Bacillariaceae sp.]
MNEFGDDELLPIRAKAREYRNSPKRSSTGGLEALFAASAHVPRRAPPQRSKSGDCLSMSTHSVGRKKAPPPRRGLMQRAASSTSFIRRGVAKSKSGPLMSLSSHAKSTPKRGMMSKAKSGPLEMMITNSPLKDHSDHQKYEFSEYGSDYELEDEEEDREARRSQSKLYRLSSNRKLDVSDHDEDDNTKSSKRKDDDDATSRSSKSTNKSISKTRKSKRRSKSTDKDKSLAGLGDLPGKANKDVPTDV